MSVLADFEFISSIAASVTGSLLRSRSPATWQLDLDVEGIAPPAFLTGGPFAIAMDENGLQFGLAGAERRTHTSWATVYKAYEHSARDCGTSADLDSTAINEVHSTAALAFLCLRLIPALERSRDGWLEVSREVDHTAEEMALERDAHRLASACEPTAHPGDERDAIGELFLRGLVGDPPARFDIHQWECRITRAAGGRKSAPAIDRRVSTLALSLAFRACLAATTRSCATSPVGITACGLRKRLLEMGALTVDGDKDGWPGPGAVLTQVGRTQVVWLGRDRGGALVRIIPPYSIYEWSEGKQRDFPSATLLLPVTTWPPSSCVERIVLCRLPYKHFFLGSRRPVSILGSLYGRICLGLHPDRVVAKLCGRSALPEIRTLATLHHAEHVLTRGHHERNDNQYYDSMGLSVGGAP